jgi:fatty acid/phospholipid biosynthesis enzyme
VIDGALLVAEDDPAVRLTLVGPPDQVSRLLAQRHATALIGGRVSIHSAREVVGMADDVVRGVRRKRDSTIRAAARGLDYVGNVEGADVPLGGPADVVVTDGFTGNVLLKGLEGAIGLFAGLSRRAADTPGRPGSPLSALLPDQVSGALLLGVKGIVVVGHGASDGPAVAGCIRLAVDAVNGGWDRQVADAFAPPSAHEPRAGHDLRHVHDNDELDDDSFLEALDT